MIRINQLKLSVGHTKADMKKKAAKMMRIPEDKILSLVPVRQSLDARKKNELLYIYSLNATVSGKEGAVIKNAKNVNVVLNTEKPYRFPEHGQEPLCHRPVIVGFGPAGMFCGLMLSVRMFVGEKEAQSPAAGTMGDMEFSEVPDEYIDPIVDQAMMDDYTLYEYLTDADTEIYK